MHINAGPGTAGVQLAAPVAVLTGPDRGHYYACNNTGLPYGAAVALYYGFEGEETPEGCVDVSLLAQCSEGDGVVKEWENEVVCYESVEGIDWSVYGV